MKKFNYNSPTEVHFGKNTEKMVGERIKKTGSSKVLVHFGGNSAKKSGLLDRIFKSLTENGISYVCLGGVVPNPRLSLIREGIALCKEKGVDFILAVGGGSVIDSAKAIGYGATNDIDVWDIYDKKAVPTACLPIGAIVTIPAAGSELSNSSVIKNEETGYKKGYRSNLCRCTFAIMNPELTISLPSWQTMAGVVDIIMHTLERYFYANSEDSDSFCELTDYIAEGLIKTVIDNSRILQKDPTNYNARAEIMWAGSLSHNDLTAMGNDAPDWSCHQLEYEVTAMFDTTHGATLASLWASWARYVYKTHPERFAKLGKSVFNIEEKSPEQAALSTISAFETFFKSIGMPTSITELGVEVTDGLINTLAYRCCYEKTRTIGTFKVLDFDDIKEIYRMSK